MSSQGFDPAIVTCHIGVICWFHVLIGCLMCPRWCRCHGESAVNGDVVNEGLIRIAHGGMAPSTLDRLFERYRTPDAVVSAVLRGRTKASVRVVDTVRVAAIPVSPRSPLDEPGDRDCGYQDVHDVRHRPRIQIRRRCRRCGLECGERSCEGYRWCSAQGIGQCRGALPRCARFRCRRRVPQDQQRSLPRDPRRRRCSVLGVSTGHTT